MKPRIIALYLPQFHPIPENDKWWGKGFTEWNNVKKAVPLCKGHVQPRVPADLGYYDLRDSEIREKQAQLAREAGIEGFCYYHYWFGEGRQLLERPFDEVLESGKPDFPFCLCWANHNWTNKSWKKSKTMATGNMIMEMRYSIEDHIKHFYHVLPAFKDNRYIKVDGKPLFAVWAPRDVPECKAFIDKWQELAKENGLAGIHFVGYTTNCSKGLTGQKKNFYSTNLAQDYYDSVTDLGFDAVISNGLVRGMSKLLGRLRLAWDIFTYQSRVPSNVHLDYSKVMKHFYAPEDANENVYPTIMPQWDRTPRAGQKTEYLINSNPEAFEKTIDDAIAHIKNKQPEHQIIFLKAWNEWGEGNYVEPDQQFGHGWLNAIKNALKKN